MIRGSFRQRPPPFLRDPTRATSIRASAAAQPLAGCAQSRAHKVDYLPNRKPCTQNIASVQPSRQAASNFERTAAVGLGAATRAAKWGMEERRRWRTWSAGYHASGDRSRPRGHALDFEAVDVRGVVRRQSPSEQARRHRRGRAWPVVSLALEKRLFLNVRRKRLLVSPFGKKLRDINERLNPF